MAQPPLTAAAGSASSPRGARGAGDTGRAGRKDSSFYGRARQWSRITVTRSRQTGPGGGAGAGLAELGVEGRGHDAHPAPARAHGVVPPHEERLRRRRLSICGPDECVTGLGWAYGVSKRGELHEPRVSDGPEAPPPVEHGGKADVTSHE